MAGASVLAVYSSDDGDDYRVRMPAWEGALQTVGTVTTQPGLPRGYRRRKRYYRVTATGREGTITVLSVGHALWTDPVGTAVTIPTLGSGTATACTLQGATGERRKTV
jgi:hypothetical protein